MSKPIKNLIVDSYKKKFEGQTGAMVIDIRGMPSGVATTFRDGLYKEGIKITVVKNSLAKAAIAKTLLEGVGKMLDGSSAVVYGGSSVVHIARLLVDKIKDMPTLTVKGAIMDGELFEGADRIKALSKFPTKEEAQAQVIQIFLGAAGQLIGAITGVGNQIAGIVDQVAKKLEKGEAIAAK